MIDGHMNTNNAFVGKNLGDAIKNKRSLNTEKAKKTERDASRNEVLDPFKFAQPKLVRRQIVKGGEWVVGAVGTGLEITAKQGLGLGPSVLELRKINEALKEDEEYIAKKLLKVEKQ
jgi:hypothetical protein